MEGYLEKMKLCLDIDSREEDNYEKMCHSQPFSLKDRLKQRLYSKNELGMFDK